MFKKATQGETEQVRTIMRKIHDENPAYWPYGLSADQFDSGGLYLVQKQASSEPVGFVGWQKFNEEGRRVGYYAIGILPEFREQGFAKQAVAGVLREIGDSCDEVKALIMASNAPSKALARSVGVPIVEKAANAKAKALAVAGPALKYLLGGAIGGAVGGPGLDYAKYGEGQTFERSFKDGLADTSRAHQMKLNTVLGALSGLAGVGVGIKGAVPIALGIPAKDLLIKADSKLTQLDVKKLNESLDPSAASVAPPSQIPRSALLVAGGLGLGALGLLAYKLKSEANNRAEMLEAQRQGQIKITLPTKKPGDAETQVSLPFSDLNLSNALRSRLGRDTKRRLHQETKERTRRRAPADPANPTEKELEDVELERELAELDAMGKTAAIAAFAQQLGEARAKSAAMAAPQSGLPSPPPLGVNPALRMSQQQMAAAAVPTAPKANPQIEQAQMQVAQTEQAAQAQLAQAQQAAGEANMQQQAQFQQEMMKAKTENDTLKLELEKQKAVSDLANQKNKMQAELAKTQAKAQSTAGDDRNSVLSQVAKARLGGIKRRLSKAAMTSWKDVGYKEQPMKPTYNPVSGAIQSDNRPVYLATDGAQRLNDSLGATSVIPDIGNQWRHSYGKLGDWFYDSFFKNKLQQPAYVTEMAPASISGSPDMAFAIQNSLLRAHAAAQEGGWNPTGMGGMPFRS